MSSTPGVSSTPTPPGMVEIDLMSTIVVLFRGYRRIILWAVVGLLLGVGLSFALHKRYTALAEFLPPVNTEIAASMPFFVRQDPSDLYLGMLSSRSVQDSVIDATHLMDVYHFRYRDQARAQLARQSSFNVEQNSLISIQVTAAAPELAASIANAYLDALYKLNGDMSASAAAHRSKFFESQLAIESEKLSEAELALKQTEERTGTILPEGEAQAGLLAISRLQSSIQDAEARLSSLLTGSTEQNPEVVRLRAQIAALREQLHQQQGSVGPKSGLPSNSNLPGLMLDNLRRTRDFKQQEALYESLTQQYEKARIAALDPGPQLQIVDRAVVPEHKSAPPRTLITVVSTLIGALLGALSLALAPLWYRLRARFVAAGIRADGR
ncbi:MAG: GNVR domain-containing protein [Acidobacteriota bacterium]